jgi:hypothetical protein
MHHLNQKSPINPTLLRVEKLRLALLLRYGIVALFRSQAGFVIIRGHVPPLGFVVNLLHCRRLDSAAGSGLLK